MFGYLCWCGLIRLGSDYKIGLVAQQSSKQIQETHKAHIAGTHYKR